MREAVGVSRVPSPFRRRRKSGRGIRHERIPIRDLSPMAEVRFVWQEEDKASEGSENRRVRFGNGCGEKHCGKASPEVAHFLGTRQGFARAQSASNLRPFARGSFRLRSVLDSRWFGREDDEQDGRNGAGHSDRACARDPRVQSAKGRSSRGMGEVRRIAMKVPVSIPRFDVSQHSEKRREGSTCPRSEFI
jgi:hypothetical protein